MAVPSTKADEIASVLEDAIVSGELPAGAVLRQEQLSAEFGVSRTPIREALRQLAALGLVSFAGKRGVQVRALSRNELLETFVVRAALEGFAAELARHRITKSDLRALSRAEERFAKLTQELRAAHGSAPETRAVASAWVRANQEFHDVFLNAAGVRALADAARNVRRVFYGQAIWSPSTKLDELYSRNIKQHRAIVEAFTTASPSVRNLVEEHVLDSGRLLEQALNGTGNDLSRFAHRVSWTQRHAQNPS